MSCLKLQWKLRSTRRSTALIKFHLWLEFGAVAEEAQKHLEKYSINQVPSLARVWSCSRGSSDGTEGHETAIGNKWRKKQRWQPEKCRLWSVRFVLMHSSWLPGSQEYYILRCGKLVKVIRLSVTVYIPHDVLFKTKQLIVLKEKKHDYTHTHHNLVAPLAFKTTYTNQFTDLLSVGGWWV